MDVKSLAGSDPCKKKPIFGNAKLINPSIMQVFWALSGPLKYTRNKIYFSNVL